MDVWIALHRWFPHGGMQRDALATARALAKADHPVTIVCARWDGPAPEDDGEGDVGAPIRRLVLGARGATNHGRVARFARDLAAAHAAAGAPFLLGFDRLPGLDAYFAADVCYVARIRGSRTPLHRLTPRYRTFARLEASVFGRDARATILSLTRASQRAYTEVYGTPAERFVPIPPGVAPDRFAPPDAAERRAAKRRSLGVSSDEAVLLVVASDFMQKGLDRVLRGIAGLSEEARRRTWLVVAGPGDVDRFREAARGACRTTFLGGTDDVSSLLLAADLLVHPARVENTGTVLVEALAAGLPVLCSGECGYADHVETSGAGVALPAPFDRGAFGRALHELLARDPAPLREAARAYAASTDLTSMHATIVRTVERLARDRRGT
ncbi:MAG: glycosyltransferase family 4 protein [Planctomycetota bacterium]